MGCTKPSPILFHPCFSVISVVLIYLVDERRAGRMAPCASFLLLNPRDSPPMSEQHEIEIRVRYQETDAMGRVHHANYINYFEIGRIELLRATGRDYRRLEDEGLYLVVSEMTCRYLGTARYDDVLRLRTTTTRMGRATVQHAYQVFRDKELIAEGTSTVACVDNDGKVRRLPDWLRE